MKYLDLVLAESLFTFFIPKVTIVVSIGKRYDKCKSVRFKSVNVPSKK